MTGTDAGWPRVTGVAGLGAAGLALVSEGTPEGFGAEGTSSWFDRLWASRSKGEALLHSPGATQQDLTEPALTRRGAPRAERASARGAAAYGVAYLALRARF